MDRYGLSGYTVNIENIVIKFHLQHMNIMYTVYNS